MNLDAILSLASGKNLPFLVFGAAAIVILLFIRNARARPRDSRQTIFFTGRGTMLTPLADEFAGTLFMDKYGGFAVMPGSPTVVRKGRVWRRITRTTYQERAVVVRRIGVRWRRLELSDRLTLPWPEPYLVTGSRIRQVSNSQPDDDATQQLRDHGQAFVLQEGDPHPFNSQAGIEGRYDGPALTRLEYQRRLNLAYERTRQEAISEGGQRDVTTARLSITVIIVVTLAAVSWLVVIGFSWFHAVRSAA